MNNDIVNDSGHAKNCECRLCVAGEKIKIKLRKERHEQLREDIRGLQEHTKKHYVSGGHELIEKEDVPELIEELQENSRRGKMDQWTLPKIEHGKLTKYNYIVLYPENLTLGKNFDIGAFTLINANYGVTIEDDVQIGSHCSIYSNNTINETKGSVVIKKGARIGSHSVIFIICVYFVKWDFPFFAHNYLKLIINGNKYMGDFNLNRIFKKMNGPPSFIFS